MPSLGSFFRFDLVKIWDSLSILMLSGPSGYRGPIKDIDDLILYSEGEYAIKKALIEHSLDLFYP